VVTLDQRRASRSEVVGSKAAALATARAAGLSVEPGFVLTTTAVANWSTDPTVASELEHAWRALSDDGRVPVIVRSSSTIEDTERSSMAGVFRSVLDVRTLSGLKNAVDEIITHAVTRGDHPFAVLVQPMIDARLGGVLFGADPVSGRTDRIVVAVVRGGPDALVSGVEHGARYVLSRRGRVLQVDGALDEIGRHERHEFVKLARRTRTLFDAPQDVEWAIDKSGAVRLLQSRPISTLGSAPRGRPQYGPGPVAETFPARLSALEADLWVPPLDEGITQALRVVGAAPRAKGRGRHRGPTVLSLDGWVVADLTALAPPPRGARKFLDPRVGARRLRSAWSTGRLRALLPQRAAVVIETADAQLAAVPPLDRLSDDELVTLLDRSRTLLRSVHGHEVLCGVALRQGGGALTTGAGAALTALERGRSMGLDDATIVAADPAVLALVPPRIGADVTLPASRPGGRGAPVSPVPEPRPATGSSDAGSLAAAREQLRLRARWVHELTARAAFALGERLAARGHLPDAGAIRDVHLDELRRALAEDRPPELRPVGLEVGSVPARFVLDDHGRPIAVIPRRKKNGAADGQGAGGGRAVGAVVDRDDARPGAVLVVRTLDPELAPLLPGLAALVAETGSVLSHLAILAREYGVATVVGVPDAVRRWPPGVRLEVDGVAGTVHALDDPELVELPERPEVDA
jgi:pyruvate,water dikinase